MYHVELNIDQKKGRICFLGTAIKDFRSLNAVLGWILKEYGDKINIWRIDYDYGIYSDKDYSTFDVLGCDETKSIGLHLAPLKEQLDKSDLPEQWLYAENATGKDSVFHIEKRDDVGVSFPFTVQQEDEYGKFLEEDYKKRSAEGKRTLDMALAYDFGKDGKDKDEAKAVKCYENSIMLLRSALAYHNLACSYRDGSGVNADKLHALSLYVIAAYLGYAKSAWCAARIYEMGWADPWTGEMCKLESQAMKYYKMAADGGLSQAAYRLGEIYRDGECGETKDLERACGYFKIAANETDAKSGAKFWLEYGECLLCGRGTDKREEEAIVYIRKAAEHGNTDAQLQMAYLCEETDTGEWLRWMSKSADGGNADAAFALGEKYSNDPDPAFAIKYLRQAARHGHYMAGVLLQELEGKEQRVKLAVLEKAAQRGDAKAQYRIGIMYLKGDGVDENSRVGVDWLESAAKLGDKNAAAELGWCYLKGIGVPRANGNRAFEWFSMAVGEGRAWKTSRNLKALKGLSVCYDEGIGVEKDRRFAHELKMKFEIAKLYKAAGV